MGTKQDLERELKKYNGGALSINQSEIMRARHKGREWARRITDGLPYWREGRTLEYMVKDVAARMYEEMNGRLR